MKVRLRSTPREPAQVAKAAQAKSSRARRSAAPDLEAEPAVPVAPAPCRILQTRLQYRPRKPALRRFLRSCGIFQPRSSSVLPAVWFNSDHLPRRKVASTMRKARTGQAAASIHRLTDQVVQDGYSGCPNRPCKLAKNRATPLAGSALRLSSQVQSAPPCPSPTRICLTLSQFAPARPGKGPCNFEALLFYPLPHNFVLLCLCY